MLGDILQQNEDEKQEKMSWDSEYQEIKEKNPGMIAVRRLRKQSIEMRVGNLWYPPKRTSKMDIFKLRID